MLLKNKSPFVKKHKYLKVYKICRNSGGTSLCADRLMLTFPNSFMAQITYFLQCDKMAKVASLPAITLP